MALNMKNFVKDKNEYVVGVENVQLMKMQDDGECDCCGKALPRDTHVLGKVVNLEGFCIFRSQFSPTCLQCANLN